MNWTHTRPVSDAVLTSMTEAELAHWHHELGTPVIHHRDRYWKQTVPGFYQPLHWMARLRHKQTTRPSPLCWGFQATLCQEDAAAANGALPVHLLSNLEDYDLHRLSSKRRTHLRKCYRLVQIVELTSPDLLYEQGYDVVQSALRRTGHTKSPTKEEYLTKLEIYTDPKRHFLLAGLIDNKLGGYLTGYAVDGVAYLEDTLLATEALPTNIGTGLRFEFVQICRRSQQICEVVSGLHSRENRSLCAFKEEMGFQLNYVPVKVQINPLIGAFIRWRYPHKYYRLTGKD